MENEKKKKKQDEKLTEIYGTKGRVVVVMW